jgi:hypothetical protein
MVDWGKILTGVIVVSPWVALAGLYYQGTLEEQQKVKDMRFVAPTPEKKPLPIGEKRKIHETEQEELPGIPPRGMKELAEY